jgi:pyruvate dehydrogenase E2 component (dihydrolipoamide acetyltransferase)
VAEEARRAVERDEPLFEISTDKVDTEIPSPAAGTLSEVLVEEGKTVGINTVVARIEGGASAAARPAAAPLPRPQSRRSRAGRRAVEAAAAAPPPRSAPRPPPRRRRTRRPSPPDRSRRWCARWRARTISISAA